MLAKSLISVVALFMVLAFAGGALAGSDTPANSSQSPFIQLAAERLEEDAPPKKEAKEEKKEAKEEKSSKEEKEKMDKPKEEKKGAAKPADD